MRFKIQYSALILLLLIAIGCKQNNNHAGELNEAANLPVELHFNQLGLKVITSMINKKEATMSTLYGNEAALKYTKSKEDSTTSGMVFALVSWKQQDDERWFGAKIPGPFQRVEMVTTKANGNTIRTSYKTYTGKWQTNPLTEQARIKYILAQKAAIMP
ncbi:cytochrome P460 family protein [Pedobacter cryoconitis]|uniref:Cytochrome P460 domain-containing protein n=1 Tax=Pedobacter cryoconitis TaxID=188932 RepID=A0A327SXR8_9SPHI|nr:cytochrome P460 family protein [Pedobacter cryoconitis]RAJ33075.1 hypothetical protein LY11_01765 [Pedobacter cryoconitis]